MPVSIKFPRKIILIILILVGFSNINIYKPSIFGVVLWFSYMVWANPRLKRFSYGDDGFPMTLWESHIFWMDQRSCHIGATVHFGLLLVYIIVMIVIVIIITIIIIITITLTFSFGNIKHMKKKQIKTCFNTMSRFSPHYKPNIFYRTRADYQYHVILWLVHSHTYMIYPDVSNNRLSSCLWNHHSFRAEFWIPIRVNHRLDGLQSRYYHYYTYHMYI